MSVHDISNEPGRGPDTGAGTGADAAPDADARDPATHPAADPAPDTAAAVYSRHSVRAFLPDPVPRATIEAILAGAARAPSGTNMQPWQVTVVQGAALARLCDRLEAVSLDPEIEPEPDYEYYPPQFPEPYASRRRACGWGLYGLLGIEKGERERMRAQHARNFRFFDAPVGLFFTVDRRLETGSWIDMGMFIQTAMLMARHYGLHSCPQAAFVYYHKWVRAEIDLPDDQALVCGMALGYEDTTKPENALRLDRAPVAEFTRFVE